jgi:predicted transcriptional regulator
MTEQSTILAQLAGDIIKEHVKTTQVSAVELPQLIRDVFNTLTQCAQEAGGGQKTTSVASAASAPAVVTASSQPAVAPAARAAKPSSVPATPPKKLVPAVPISESVTPDYIICLEDGKKFKMMKRWIRTQYHMTPEQYRAKWDLPDDYPMIAPNARQAKSAYAKMAGLGTDKLGRPEARRKRA